MLPCAAWGVQGSGKAIALGLTLVAPVREAEARDPELVGEQATKPWVKAVERSRAPGQTRAHSLPVRLEARVGLL